MWFSPTKSVIQTLSRTPIQALSRNFSSTPANIWSLGKLNHVAIAVPDLAKATALYRDMLGATVSAPQVFQFFNEHKYYYFTHAVLNSYPSGSSRTWGYNSLCRAFKYKVRTSASSWK